MDAALVQPTSVRDEALGILSRLGVLQSAFAREGVLASSPITGELIAYVRTTPSMSRSWILRLSLRCAGFNAPIPEFRIADHLVTTTRVPTPTRL
jgi:hypothetical protein